MLIFDILITVLLIACFCFVHSILASEKIKIFADKNLGRFKIFYRLLYNIISAAFLIAVFEVSPKPPVIVYDLPYPIDLVVFFFQAVSLIGLVYALSGINMRDFLGIEQIINYYYGSTEEEEPHKFRKDKLYKYMRHPVYFFALLFAGLRPQMDVFYFTAFVCLSSYFYIGSYFEEKKLIKQFGDSYIEYQKSVPRILPLKFTNK